MRRRPTTIVFLSLLVLLLLALLPLRACEDTNENDGEADGGGGGEESPAGPDGDEDPARVLLQSCHPLGAECSRNKQCCEGMRCLNGMCFDNADAYCLPPHLAPPIIRGDEDGGRRRRFRGRELSTCSSRSDCCKTGQWELTCHGTTSTNKECVPCKKAKRPCHQSSQCCSGLSCKNKKCQ
jgi:hypothetical protein